MVINFTGLPASVLQSVVIRIIELILCLSFAVLHLNLKVDYLGICLDY